VISQTSEYALRAVVCLGGSLGRPLTTRAIADQTKVPYDYLSKVLQGLSRAGMVDSQRGVGGGFVLARPFDNLTVLDVINAVDPLKRFMSCPLGLDEHRRRLCSLHKRLDEGIALVEALYGGTTIAELLAQANPSRPLCEEVGPVSIRVLAPTTADDRPGRPPIGVHRGRSVTDP
jgi:Rrf2 family protein